MQQESGGHTVEVMSKEDTLWPKHQLGQTSLFVSKLCVGTSPLGGAVRSYGYDVSETEAIDTLLAVFESGINFLDTGNSYSDGASERRIGKSIREYGGLPEGFVLATKLDPRPGPRFFEPGTRSFSGTRAWRSFEESTERLGLDKVPLLYLHDPELFPFDEITGPGGPLEALVEIRDKGLAESIGVAGGDIEEMLRYAKTGLFDVVLNHNRYTLIDQSAEPLINFTAKAGIAFVNAAPFGGGLLVKGALAQPNYKYQPASVETLERMRVLESVTHQHEFSLASAALQFSTRDPRISSTVVGISRCERIAELTQMLEVRISNETWNEIKNIQRRKMD